jgi:serine/threonine protein kinase
MLVSGASAGVFLLLLSCFSMHLWLQKRRLLQAKRRFFEQNGGLLLQQQLGSLAGAGVTFKIFSEEEIGRATDSFAEAQVLGRGVVYKGILPDGSTVAVKKSRVVDAKQVMEFAREMLILSQINHRDVVKLLGCCLEVEVPMLVYEYVPNGSLHSHIHGDGGESKLLPGARLRIAAESADALAYMHSSASPPILHRDVKSANILLDGDLAAKVSDFGASRWSCWSCSPGGRRSSRWRTRKRMRKGASPPSSSPRRRRDGTGRSWTRRFWRRSSWRC